MSIINKYETIESIAEMILKCIEGKDKGTHRKEYLESELYGCCEKRINQKDEESGDETNRTHTKKCDPNVFIVRFSEKAYTALLNSKKINTLEDYIKVSVDELKKIGLRSEHIYPRKALSEALLKMKSPTKEDIIELINKRCKVAYITKEEEELLDKKLTKDTIKKFDNYSDEDKQKYNIKVGACLKYKMPDCWEEDDEVEVRLTARGIELKSQKFLVSDI